MRFQAESETEGRQANMDQNYQAVLNAVVEAAVDAILVIDRNGAILSFNPAAQRMFGYSEDEVLGSDVSCLMPEPDRSRHQGYIDAYERTRKAKIIGLGRDVTARKKNGELFPIHLSVGEIKNDILPGYVGIIHDISARTRARKELDAQRDRLAQVTRLTTVGEMASGIAHEVNQPLSAIANYTRALELMIENGTARDEKTRDIVEKIRRQAQRAGDVIRRVRKFSANRETTAERIHLDDLIQETRKLAETDAIQHGRSIDLELQAACVLEVDPVQLQQVLLNLIRNGLEAMKETDPTAGLTVSTMTEQRNALIHVSDTGCGISPEHEQRLFAPFHTTKRDGMGLGLTISRSIVESYGGKLVYQPNLPQGSIFTVQIPIEPEKME